METTLDIISAFLPLLFSLFMFIVIFGFPLLIIYAIYRAVIGIMTHNANLKNQQNNDK